MLKVYPNLAFSVLEIRKTVEMVDSKANRNNAQNYPNSFNRKIAAKG